MLLAGLLLGSGSARASSHIVYVDGSATGANAGSSWTNAFTNLEDALTGAGDEIWAAGGTYVPGANRSDSFVLVEAVALYGGFAGGETERGARDWAANPTILSGDIGTAGDPGDNSYHVLRGANLTSATILDGFTISGGNANSANFPESAGGGLYCDGSSGGQCSPTLTNVTFSGNSATYGGAIYNSGQHSGDSSPTLTNVILWGNSAGTAGDVMYNAEATPAISYSVVEGGSAGAGLSIYKGAA